MIDRPDKLLHVRHQVSMNPHIIVDTSKCDECESKSCLYFCPAGCFVLKDDSIDFNYEGCLECGTCRVMCSKGIQSWDYPLGGYGVSFRIG